MIRQITQRLHEVNTLLATYGQGVLSFEQALPPSLFYQDFNDTNLLVKEAACLVKENPGQLLDFSSSLLSLDRTPLQTVNFEALFEEYLSPFEHRYEEAKTAATELWREYSAMSNRLDFLPLDSEEYRSLDTECGVAKAKYDQAHAHATYHIRNGSRSVTGISVSGASNRYSSTCWWSVCKESPEASSPTSDA